MVRKLRTGIAITPGHLREPANQLAPQPPRAKIAQTTGYSGPHVTAITKASHEYLYVPGMAFHRKKPGTSQAKMWRIAASNGLITILFITSFHKGVSLFTLKMNTRTPSFPRSDRHLRFVKEQVSLFLFAVKRNISPSKIPSDYILYCRFSQSYRILFTPPLHLIYDLLQ